MRNAHISEVWASGLQQFSYSVSVLHTLTSIASLAVDAFFRSAANSPIPIHKEAVT